MVFAIEKVFHLEVLLDGRDHTQRSELLVYHLDTVGKFIAKLIFARLGIPM